MATPHVVMGRETVGMPEGDGSLETEQGRALFQELLWVHTATAATSGRCDGSPPRCSTAFRPSGSTPS